MKDVFKCEHGHIYRDDKGLRGNIVSGVSLSLAMAKEIERLQTRIAELESQMRTYQAKEYDRQQDNKFENF